MTTTRDQIIASTCDLMENQGYHATGLSQIVKESGAPKGSIYYYFPQGKEEIAVEAIQRAGQTVAERIEQGMGTSEPVSETVPAFVRNIAHFVELSGFQSGGPLTAIAMETATTNERLNLACREAYSRIQAAFKQKLIEGGFSPDRVESLAVFITSTIEGGIILSRTYHSSEPLRNAADQLALLLQEG